MFDNRKIKALRRLPDGNNIVLIWVMLLTMAGRCNAGGMIFLTENIPYTPKMLADELDFEENTVLLALEALERFSMVTTDAGNLTVAGWEEYQNVDRLAEIREYNRLAQQRSRANRKALPDVNDMSMTRQRCHDTDIDKDTEEDKEKRKEKKETYTTVVAYLNEKAGTRYRATTEKTKKAINARLGDGFTVEDFKTVIDKKCAEWMGTDMEKYLCPETLFGTKFEKYLNQKTGNGRTGNGVQARQSDLDALF